MTEYRLISSDSHVSIPDEAWQEYLDPACGIVLRIERTDEGDFRVFEGRRTPINALSNLAGKKPEDYSLNLRKLKDSGPAHGIRPSGSRTWKSTESTSRCSTSVGLVGEDPVYA